MPTSKYFTFLKAMDSAGVPRDRQAGVVEAAWSANGNHQSALGTALHRAVELTLNEERVIEPPDAEEQCIAYTCPVHTGLVSELFKLPPAAAAAIRSYALTGAPIEDSREVLPPRVTVKEYRYFEQWWSDNPQLLPARTEWSIYSWRLKLAGQLDGLFYDAVDNIHVMADWKRTASMDYTAFRGRCGIPPCDVRLPAGHAN